MARKAALLLFFFAVLLAGGAAPMRGQAILDALDPSPNANDLVLSENFDGVTAPALPAGWVATNPVPGNGVMWATSAIMPDTPPNSAFIDDQDGISDKVLDSPPITISSASTVLSFRNNFDLESSGGFYWDGGVLEVSSPNINGGAFTDITNAAVGGSFVSGGYIGNVDGTCGNPLAGRMAWSGFSGGYINTVVNLGSNVNGQTITLRFRMGSDCAVYAPGWRIDSLTVTSGLYGTPTPTPPPGTPTPTPSPSLVEMVSLPTNTISTSVTTFTEPVVTSAINAANNLIGFQGDFTFDSSVVTFQSTPVSSAGLTASNWNVTGFVQAGGGPIRTLRISAFSNDVTPLSGSGILFSLNMLRVSSTPGANTALAWAAPPDDFFFIDKNLDTSAPVSTPPGSITIAQGVTVSGTVTYCSNPSLNPAPGVTLTATGTASASTSSDGSGNYALSLPIGGSYTLTPTKAARIPGSSGIDNSDVIAVLRHFLNIGTPLSGCKLTAADVNGDTTINVIDVIAIQRFFLGSSAGTSNVGKYQFSPASRSYPGLFSDQTGQNYDALVFGDVASPFVE